ncbi:MAG: efflux RND transporter periplasmic adaptor subunit [Proteobacteria bacterium]|nr:efflux RND transporter periplasmic adaptor subunit [Pseudomonadota bacterium]
MDDKRQLLGELTLDDDQREPAGVKLHYYLTAAAAVLLAGAAWYFLTPGHDAITVKVATAERATGNVKANVDAVLDASGYVTARRQATVSSKVTGKVSEVFIEEGMVVKAGDLLATLDDSSQRAALELTRAQLAAVTARLEEVRIQVKEAELLLARTSELTSRKLASTADLDNASLGLEAARARLGALEMEVRVADRTLGVQQLILDDMQILAPFDGVVVTKAAQPGEMISPVSGGGGFTRTGICTLVDMDSLEVEVDVNEAYINRVNPGQPVVATLNSYPDWEVPAEVITIIPTADRSKATVRVRIGFKERDDRILPDMGVRVSFLEEQMEQAPVRETLLTGVLIPTGAIATTDLGSIVYRLEQDRIRITPVVLGPRQGTRRSVTEGLQAGDRVVTGLNDDLKTRLTEDRQVTVEPPSG